MTRSLGNILHVTAPRHQRGMVLVFSLIILLVLTILGVGTLRTSSLEQLMSGSTQETMRSFQAADSGVDKGLNQIKTSTPADPLSFSNSTAYSYSQMGATATAQTPTLIQIGQPVRSTKPTGYGTSSRAYYDQQIIGRTPSDTLLPERSRTVLHQGITTGAPANQYSP